MNRGEAFRILEIDVTDDKKVIKKAYAELVKKYHPEEYPEKWQEIHEAYETALKGVGTQQQPFSIYMDDNGTGITFVYSGAAPERDNFDQTKQEKKPEWEEWEEYKESEREREERKRERGDDSRKDERQREEREKRKEEWENYRKNERKREEEKQDEWEHKIEEDQDINNIFENIDELMQEKRKQEKEEQAKKEVEREKRKKLKKLKKKIVNCGIYITIFMCILGLYEQKIKEAKEKTWMNEVTEYQINSIEDMERISEEQKEWQYKTFYLPVLAGFKDEEQQKRELDRSIGLQEGIRLTAPNKTGVYRICEEEVPEQLKSLVEEEGANWHTWAFCITSNEEPECRPLWCDMEKLGFGDQVRIFYYDEDKEEYVERELFHEDAVSEQSSYEILGYRVFIIDTHVHDEGEKCGYPIVFIERTDDQE